MQDALELLKFIFGFYKVKKTKPKQTRPPLELGQARQSWKQKFLLFEAFKSSTEIPPSESTPGQKTSGVSSTEPFQSCVPLSYPKVLRAESMDNFQGPNFLFCQNHQRSAICNFTNHKTSEKNNTQNAAFWSYFCMLFGDSKNFIFYNLIN